MKRHVLCALAALAVAAALPLYGATFFVPNDRALIHRADAIVVATASTVQSQLNRAGGIETVTTFNANEVLKGDVGMTFLVDEPGGEYGGHAMLIPGVPQFTEGEKTLLFLARTGPDRWAVAELAVGKFSFRRSTGGKSLLMRDASEIRGWNPDFTPHSEAPRAAEPFLQFIRDEVRGLTPDEHYFTAERSLATTTESTTASMPPIAATIAPYTATSYTMTISGSMGSRWNVFPNPVTFYMGTQQEPGAPGGGSTAITTAIASWDNDCGSNVNYVFGGTDTGGHTQGLHAADGANTVLFEQDLSAWGVSPFTCSSNGYSGTLGIGGVTNASGTNTVNGETFMTTLEGDVEMNKGLANCTLLFSNGDFNSAVTHELGHTLGFRHSDQDRSSAGACTSDPSLECSNNAIMKAFVSTGLNAALQAWDQHAVDAVYPGNVCAPSSPPPPSGCTPPSITQQPVSTMTNGTSFATLTVGVSGTSPFTVQWYFGSTGQTGQPVAGGTGTTLQVSPAATTQYWVRVSNSCGSVNSATATVTFTGGSVGNPVRLMNTSSSNWIMVGAADFTGDGYPDILFENSVTGDIYLWVMSGTNVANSNVYIGTVSSTNWQIRGLADFDRNGTPDIIFQNRVTGVIAAWTMSGTTVLNKENVIGQTSSTNWQVVAAADFNADGYPDLLFQNISTNMIVIWTMHGFTVTNNEIVLGTSSSGWTVQTAADFNGDGYADVVFRKASTGQNALWYTKNLQPVSVENLFPTLVGTGWRIAAAADFNKDGVPDLLWQNSGTTEAAIWLINSSLGLK